MTDKIKEKADLKLNGDLYNFDVHEGTIGPDVLDISKLYAQSGKFTYDPGFTSTANCKSTITYIDGEEGTLLYRGYPIDQLAEQGNYLETCYLLLNGELPNQDEYTKFEETINEYTLVNEQLNRFFTGFRPDAHPMAIMCGVVGALSAFYHDSLDINDPEQRRIACHRLIAKMPTLAAMAYKHSLGQPFMYPKNDLDYAANFLNMCFGLPTEDKNVDSTLAKAMDKILILHADHEQNASTSTVRLAGSSGANPFACIASGIACLWGPAHGGANEACIRMLEEINSVDNIPEYVKKAKDKNDPFRLMGFGHRVYKSFDPRAKIIKVATDEVLDDLGVVDPVLDIAKGLEKEALSDKYFVDRSLYPNVDFYSGIIYRAMGIPSDMFTVMFALGRLPGWIAQWREMRLRNEPIGRPRQVYTGENHRKYTPISNR